MQLASSPSSAIFAQSPRARTPALLQAPRGIEELGTRSRVVLQLSGTLQVADPDPSSKKPPREAEVKAESTVDFDERIALDRDNAVQAAARHYHEASVKTWVAGHASSHQLRPECRDARLMRNDGVWQQYCPDEPLQPREIDLVRLPVNTAVLDQLLPASPVKPDSSWSPEERTVAELFNLEAVHSTTLEARVVEVEKNVAKIEYEGTIEGTANSVPTKLEVTGNLQATLGSRCALVTWVGMSLRETRDISQAEPGFHLTARIKLIRKEEPDACADVDVDQLRALAASDDEGRWLVRIASVSGRYQMLADRRWKTIVDAGDESIVRLVEKNQVVAQCNITRLPKLNAGQQLTLAGMQDDIRRSLAESLEQILEAGEKVNSGGLRLLRVVAIGQTSDVPVRWVYTHLSDDTGRRVSLVFTMSGEAAEQFGAADEQMAGSFELLPEPVDAEPTPADEAKTIEAASKTSSRKASNR
ncbi:MAG: hypothetical protein ACTHK7_03635 [Aureliella sp.]